KVGLVCFGITALHTFHRNHIVLILVLLIMITFTNGFVRIMVTCQGSSTLAPNASVNHRLHNIVHLVHRHILRYFAFHKLDLDMRGDQRHTILGLLTKNVGFLVRSLFASWHGARITRLHLVHLSLGQSDPTELSQIT